MYCVFDDVRCGSPKIVFCLEKPESRRVSKKIIVNGKNDGPDQHLKTNRTT